MPRVASAGYVSVARFLGMPLPALATSCRYSEECPVQASRVERPFGAQNTHPRNR